MKRTLLALVSALALTGPALSQERGHAGVALSPAEAGIVVDWLEPGARGGYKFMASVSYWDLMTSPERHPAFFARILYDIPIWEKPLRRGVTFGLLAGTGAAIGVSGNYGIPTGPVFALAVETGASFELRAPVAFRLLFHADVGMHIDPVTAYNTTVRFFRPGVLHAYIPSVEVLFRF